MPNREWVQSDCRTEYAGIRKDEVALQQKYTAFQKLKLVFVKTVKTTCYFSEHQFCEILFYSFTRSLHVWIPILGLRSSWCTSNVSLSFFCYRQSDQFKFENLYYCCLKFCTLTWQTNILFCTAFGFNFQTICDLELAASGLWLAYDLWSLVYVRLPELFSASWAMIWSTVKNSRKETITS